MGYTIVVGNKPSSVALHQTHAIVFIEMLLQMPKFYSKSQNSKNQVQDTNRIISIIKIEKRI